MKKWILVLAVVAIWWACNKQNQCGTDSNHLAPSKTAVATDSDFAKIEFGEHWYGAPLDQSNLAGKVLVLEQWGMF